MYCRLILGGLLLISTAMFLLSCTTTDPTALQVTSPLPSGVQPSTGGFFFTFSHKVVPPDSTNRWTTMPYIEFTPAIPGTFVWQDTSRLVFSPDAPLAGDTKYSARLNTQVLLALSGTGSFTGPEKFEFSTESFTLRSAEFFYDRIGRERKVGVRANLVFSYAVNPVDVLNAIRVTVDRERLTSIHAPTTEKSTVIPLELGIVAQAEKEREISITFDEGLISEETGTRIKLERPFVYNLPRLEELKIHGHESGFDGTLSWIRIRTSQEVDPATVKSFITIDPVRDFKIEGDRESIVLRGKLDPGTQFRMVVKKGLSSILGGKTQNEYDATIVIGNVKPSFRFTSASGSYMLLSGARSVDIKTVNLSQLAVRVSQIFQNNLLFFLDQGRYYDWYWYEDDDWGFDSRRKYRYVLGNYGRQLDYDTIPIASVQNQEVSTTFDVSPYLNTGYKGFYLVEIANPAEAWRSTAKLLSVSDIGLIVKQSADEVVVFAVSLDSNAPLPGTAISLISTNNQVLATQKADKDGVARFGGFRETAKDFRLKLITAELDQDFNFINLADYRVETSRFDVGGKRDVDQMYDALMYGDRNIYRPGEKVYVSGVVRNLTREVPAGLPVRLKIFNPRGTLVSEQQHTLNEQGSFESSHQTQFTAQTGTYRFELYTGNNVFLTSYLVSVEDFVPDRLKVELKASKEKAKPGEKITYQMQALNFFGPPAAGRNWEFEGSFDIIPYRSERFPAFRFSDDAASNYSANPEIYTGKTDDDGRATIEFPLPANLTSTGLLRARARVGVFDETGRPVYQIAQTTVYPKDYYIGVQRGGEYYIAPNTPQTMQIIAVDQTDNPIAGFKARIEIVRKEWHTALRQHQGTGTLRYVSEQREIPVSSDAITLDQKPVEYTYQVPHSGEFVVRISKDGDTGYNQFSFYAYRWGTADITSFDIDPEARIDIVADKKQYAPGEKARMLFKAPFSGKMLVTIERKRVFSYRYLEVENNAASMEVDVTEGFLPNVYISAVLFRKVKEMNIPLLVGHGFAPILVEKASNKLEVVINAPQKIRPKTKQKITVAVKEKDVFLTLAAVDEGICQVKNYKTPDPYGHFYARKALQTETFDFFKHLMPEPERQVSSVGGGDDGDEAKRVNPLGVQRFKPVAIWSGILRSDGNGNAEVTLDVPEFSGELRLMAFAYKSDRFGSAEKPVKVADPVIITPALPRFLSPGDSVVMAITAFNTTEKTASLKFSIETSGGVVAVSRTASLDVGANQERHVNIALKAANQIGKSVVTVKTSAFGEQLESVTEIPVRPVSPFVSEGTTGFVDGGSTASLNIEDAYLPYARRSFITLSPFPVANFAKNLKYLVGYPHGCLEQTVSKAFPQIYLRDIAVVLAPSILDEGSPTYFVNEAITKITNLQMHDGAFMYWPEGGYTNTWTTVYATHFMLEAKKAGYAVPEQTLKSALGAVGAIARSKQTQDYYYREGNKTVVKRIADKSAVYALYVLALGGQPEKMLMAFYRTERVLLTTDTRYLLAGAFALSGDRKTYTDLLPKQFAVEEANRTSGHNFDSPIRANALILNILLETDLNNPAIARYMEYLSSIYKGSYWYSTQDDAFTLLAFGKAARMASATKVEGTVTIGSQQHQYKGGNERIDLNRFGEKVTIALKGDGRVYYSLVAEGIRTDGKVKVEDKNLQARREFFDRAGNAVDLRSVRQNDLLIVRLTVTSGVDHVENVAISDLLPAGFEIENPRITESTNYPFIKNASQPQYLDIRDDRLNLYTSFFPGKRQHQFYYMVRAVSQGEFVHAPLVAEAMYDAQYYSAHGGGVVSVGR